MNTHTLRVTTFALFAALLCGCAQIKPISGGEKDLVPPALLTCHPPNFSVRFASDRFEMAFDEFVQLSNVAQELIVSPPLAKKPTVLLRDKVVRVLLNAPLEANTTYTFNFGKSVTDLNEGNPAADLLYVCTTGEVLDSLQVRGKLRDAWTGLPAEGIKVMLFDTVDSAACSSGKPLYFARSKSDGSFTIGYLREGQYQMIALGDSNDSFMLEDGELFASASGVVMPTPPSDTADVAVAPLSPYRAPLSAIPDYAADSAGVFSMRWPAGTSLPEIRAVTEGLSVRLSYDSVRENLQVWLVGPVSDRLEGIHIAHAQTGADTLSVPFFTDVLRTPPTVQWVSPQRRLPGTSWQWGADQWLIAGDNPRCVFRSGTASVEVPLVPALDGNLAWTASFEPPPGSSTECLIPGGCLKNLVGISNDSSTFKAYTLSAEDLGIIRLKIEGIERLSRPMLLINAKDKPIRVQEAAAQMELTDLEPGEYEFRLLDDYVLPNGRWDAADPVRQRLAEPLYLYPGKTNVKANWEVQLRWAVPPPANP